MPRVSVIIPAYNAAAFLDKAIGSALGQTMADIEVIVVDDGSNDDTARVAGRIAETDDRLHLIKLAENRGVSAARNAALDTATGEWVAVLDADDWYDSERLERMTEAAEAASADVVMDNQMIFREGSDLERGYSLLPDGEGFFFLSTLAFLKSARPFTGESYASLQPMFRRSIIEAHRLRYREDMHLGEDANFLLRFLANARNCIVLRRPCYFRLLRSKSLRSGWSKAYVSARFKAYDELLELHAHDRAVAELLTQRRDEFRYFARVMTIFVPARQFKLGRAVRAGLRDLPAVPGFLRHVARLLINRIRARFRLSATSQRQT